MFCTKCGAKNDDNAKFCVECGNKLEHVIPAGQKVQQGDASYVPSGNQQGEIPRFIPSDRMEKRKNSLFGSIKPVPVIVTVLLVIAVLLLGKMLFSGGQEKKLKISSKRKWKEMQKFLSICFLMRCFVWLKKKGWTKKN